MSEIRYFIQRFSVGSQKSKLNYRQQQSNKTRNIKKSFSIAILLVIVTLMLSACSYPGQDLPCQGANATQAGCTNPSLQITDTNPGGSWYVNWSLDIIRPIIADGATSSVKLSINVFWSLFTNLSSIDFAGCVNNNSNNNGNTTPPAICTASNAYSTIQIVAVALIPLILVWKIFKSYIVGALVEQAHESFWSLFAKIFLGAFIIPFLPDIITITLGMSDLIFSSIIGSAQSINDVASNILGHGNCDSSSFVQHTTINNMVMATTTGNFGASAPFGLNHLFATTSNLAATPTTPSGCSGIQSISKVQNIGLLIVITLFCLLTSVIWVLLGLCFLLRGIILFILFCLSPLAVVAGMTEEFRPWLGRWLEQMQAMLIAPIPVAVCIALVEAFSKSLPSAHDDPANFILQLIYVVAFLLIAALLMFKIAGAAGGVMFGLAVAGLSAAAGLVTGGIGAGIANIKSGGSAAGATGEETAATATYGAAGASPVATTTTTAVVASSRGATTAASTGESSAGGTAAAPVTTSVAVIQSQTEMTSALRTMNANNSANMINNAGGSAMLSNFRFGHTAHSNMQAMGHYLGNAVGVSGPRFSFVPSGGGYYGGGRSSYCGGSYGDGPSSISTSNSIVIVNGGGDGGASASNSPADNESAPPPPDSDSPTIKGAIGELFRWPNSGDNGGGNAGNSNPPSPAPVPNNGGGGSSSVSVSPATPRQRFKPMPDAPVWTSVPSSYPTDYNPDWNGQADKFGTGGLYPDVAKTPVPRAVDSTKNPVANPFVGNNKPQVPPLLALTASGIGSTNGNKPGEQDISTPQVEE